jgi:hypothetical protein
MLTKNDIRLFELLDEYIDKSLDFWCIVKFRIEWLSQDKKYIRTKSKNISYMTSKTYVSIWWSHCREFDKDIDYRHELENQQDFWASNLYVLDSIIWHYPTLSTVLRYIKNSIYNFHIMVWQQSILIDTDFWDIKKTYKIDITKELKDYTEEQKWELIEFLDSIK